MVLVGMMGAGKTTVGRRLARRLGRPFIDSDLQVEARTGRTVREIFEADGEPAFRSLETEALAEALATSSPCVIAAAGGTVLSEINRERMRSGATVIWLRADPAELAERVRSGVHRPLLADDPAAVLRDLEAERRTLYEAVADHVVDTSGRDPDAVLADLEQLVMA
ncbi:MAG TPA: shikimate kinase [Acidimicrobiales bacterium]|nr:shikimate kinase [Acidimicrobiales bacterium]